GHLQGLNLHRNTTTPATTTDPPTQSRDHTGLFCLGYGDWCGPASATLIGVGAPAAATSPAAAQRARLYRSPQRPYVRVTHTQSNAPKTRQPKLTKVATLTSG